jgi:hypothetical protein
MTSIRQLIVAGLCLCCYTAVASAGVVNPDCTADKAAKHAAEKATVGVSTNRCSPSKTAKNAAKDAVGVDQKGPIEKHASKNDTPAEKAKDAIKH